MTSPCCRVALLALATLLSGCGRARAYDCRDLDMAINAGVTRLEAHEAARRQRAGGSPAETARDMRRAAELHRQTLAALKALALSDPEVKPLADDYIASLSSVAGSAEALATALEGDQRTEALASDELYVKMLERQKRVVERVNAACTR